MKTTEIIKVYADAVYISFLPESNEERDLLQEYICEQGFNFSKFVDDAKKDLKNKTLQSIYAQLFPPELLAVTDKKLENIEVLFKNIRKGGYVRAIINLLYDLRFRQEFNNLEGTVLQLPETTEPTDIEIVDEYFKKASYQDVRTNISLWDMSTFTERKQVGRSEKLNNPYSGYKVYGQGEYSKLRIGYEFPNGKATPIKDLRKTGFTGLFDQPAIYEYETNAGQKISVIPQIDWNKAVSDKQYLAAKRDVQILELQTDAISKLLQKHDGSFVPFGLNSKVIKNAGKPDEYETTLRQELHNACKSIYFENINETKNLDKLEKYSSGSKFEESEIVFVNRYFGKINDGVAENCRDDFDAKTGYKFADSKVSVEQKIEAIWNLIGSKNIDFLNNKDEILRLKTDDVWYGIITKFDVSNSITDSSIKEDGTNFILDSQEDEKAENPVESVLASKYFKFLFARISEYITGNSNFLSAIEGVLRKIEKSSSISLSLSSRKKQFLSAVGAVFPDKLKLAKEYCENLQCDNLDWDNFEEKVLPNDDIDKLKAVYALWCFDKDRSWDCIWRWYKNRTLDEYSDEEMELDMFRRKMHAIYAKLLEEVQK